MRPMRSGLLWMARNETLRERLPRMPFARRAVRRFMPGETLEDALRATDERQLQGHGVVFTHLGENLTSLAQAQAVADHYREVLARGASPARARPVEISVKPTQLGLDQDPEACFWHCDALAAAAEAAGTWLWLDMEGSAYTEATVSLYERLRAGHERVGICLQAYLHRTAADAHRLRPLRPSVRLVKGAYDEPASISWRDRHDVDASFQALALLLAEGMARAGPGPGRLALGTHDTELIDRIGTMADGAGLARGAFEVHMLYGIREAELARLRDEGWATSSLVAYGSAWYAWYMRRLAERPANVLFALRQLLP